MLAEPGARLGGPDGVLRSTKGARLFLSEKHCREDLGDSGETNPWGMAHVFRCTAQIAIH